MCCDNSAGQYFWYLPHAIFLFARSLNTTEIDMRAM